MTTHDDVVNDIVRVEVRVKATLRSMHKTYEVVETERETHHDTFDFTVSHDVDLGQYKA